jgi:hypothetical protein
LNDRKTAPTWRDDIDALVFRLDLHEGHCVVHRHAFRTLLRFSPNPRDCEVFFRAHVCAFHEAASAKILRDAIPRGVNFHLTSRDVAREIKK